MRINGSRLTALEAEAQRQDVPKVTQCASGRARIQTQVYVSLKPMPVSSMDIYYLFIDRGKGRRKRGRETLM